MTRSCRSTPICASCSARRATRRRYEELNLRVIETFAGNFPDVVIGFSSHDAGISMPLVAYMLGSRMFEKHFTLNRTWKGTDQAFSLGARRAAPRGARSRTCPRVASATVRRRPYASENGPLSKMVKRIVAARPLRAGTTLTERRSRLPHSRVVQDHGRGAAAMRRGQPYRKDPDPGHRIGRGRDFRRGRLEAASRLNRHGPAVRPRRTRGRGDRRARTAGPSVRGSAAFRTAREWL